MSVSEQTLHDEVTRILGPDGIALRENGMTFNEKQLAYSLAIASGLLRYDPADERAALTTLQAATGVGKTLGYLIPLMLYAAHTGERVAVSTFTRHLQHQIMAKDGPRAVAFVKTVTGRELKLARRLGIRNYVSARQCERLGEALAKQGGHDAAVEFLKDLQAWVSAEVEGTEGQRLNSGVFDDYLADRGLSKLPDGLRATDLALRREERDASDMAGYERDVLLSKNADVVVVNHALLALNAMRWADVIDDLDARRMSVVVADEADRMPDAAASMLTTDVPLHRMDHLVRNVAKILKNPSLATCCQPLLDHITSIKPPSNDFLPLQGDMKVTALIEGALGKLAPIGVEVATMLRSTLSAAEAQVDLARSVPGAGNERAILSEFVDATNDLIQFQLKLRNRSEALALISWSPVRAYPSLRVGDPNPGRIFNRYWAKLQWNGEDGQSLPPCSYLKAAVFTSATLAEVGQMLPTCFDSFHSSIGVYRLSPKRDPERVMHNVQLDLLGIYEPKIFGSMRFVLADPREPNPTLNGGETDLPSTNPLWLDYAASMVRAAAGDGNGTLVLTTSFDDTKEIAERLVDLPGLMIHVRGEPVSTLLQQYRDARSGAAGERTPAVLISPAAWEGVDLPGMIDRLVITRLPFSPLDNVEEQVLRLELRDRGFAEDKIERILSARRILDAKRKFSQGLGRGIRAVTDKVEVWIADPRFPVAEPQSTDPVMMDAVARKTYRTFVDSIPARFRQNYREQTVLWLARENKKYTVEME